MTKSELIKDVAEETGYTQEVAKCIVNATFARIIHFIGLGETVTLRGFGEFAIKVRGVHKGRNPQTGESMDIPAHTICKFKTGSLMKAAAKGVGGD